MSRTTCPFCHKAFRIPDEVDPDDSGFAELLEAALAERACLLAKVAELEHHLEVAHQAPACAACDAT